MVVKSDEDGSYDLNTQDDHLFVNFTDYCYTPVTNSSNEFGPCSSTHFTGIGKGGGCRVLYHAGY